MPNISALPAVTTVDPSVDVLPLVSNAGASTTKATPNNIVNAVTKALATGLLKNTTGTGALTIAAAGTDYASPTATQTLGSTTLTLGGTVTTVAGLTLTTAAVNGTLGATTASTAAVTTLTASSTVTLSPASANVAISPTGTGTVTINPATASTINNCSIVVPAGTTAVAPLDFVSGTNLTTALAGAFEYDGAVHYSTATANCRGVSISQQFCMLSSTYTLTSQTPAQKLFNTSANGAVTLPVGTFAFECYYALSSMSVTSGSFGFALGGTATKTEAWYASAKKTALATAASSQESFNTAANTTLATASTNTVAAALIRGIIRVTVAGTLIPQVSLGVAAAAVVSVGSYFSIRPLGSSTVTLVGNWS